MFILHIYILLKEDMGIPFIPGLPPGAFCEEFVKTRIFAQLPLIKSIVKTQEVYFLKNDAYAVKPTLLDIQMPAECKDFNTPGFVGQTWTCGKDTALYISRTQVALYYCPNSTSSWDACTTSMEMQFTSYYLHANTNPGKTTCYFYHNSATAKYLCKSLLQ